jgi:hypothetical protein
LLVEAVVALILVAQVDGEVSVVAVVVVAKEALQTELVAAQR